MNYREIIAYVLIGALTFFGITKSCSNGDKDKQIVSLTAQLKACMEVPPDTIIRHDSIVIPGTNQVVIKPVKVVVHDTLIKQIAESWYDTVYKGNGWRFRYKFNVLGLLKNLEFSDFVIPKESITITKTMKVDTCLTPVRNFRIGAYMDFTTHSLKDSPGVGLGLQAIIKQKYTIGIGVLSDRNGLGENLRFGVLF